MKSSKRTSRNTTGNRLLRYDDITLRLYLDVASSGDYRKLAVGFGVTDKECYNAWEEIVRRNNEANQSQEFNTYFESTQSYAKLIADYNIIKASLLYLSFTPDSEIIKYLAERGYNIDTSSSIKYMETLELAMHKSNNIVTKLKMKENELAMMGEKSSGQGVGFEEIMANISFLVGFPVPEDITLARYNEFRKIIKKRHDQLERSKNKKGNV
jgi:hypothetical protein